MYYVHESALIRNPRQGQGSAVADLEVISGGFYYSVACEGRTKIFVTTPTLGYPFSDRFGDFLLYLSIDPFSIKIYVKAC